MDNSKLMSAANDIARHAVETGSQALTIVAASPKDGKANSLVFVCVDPSLCRNLLPLLSMAADASFDRSQIQGIVEIPESEL